MIHHLADVQTRAIGINTDVWQFSVILKGARIGDNCNINCHTFIENNVVIGNNVTVKAGIYLWDGIVVEDNVFLGPNVTFTNDRVPRSKKYPDSFQNILIKRHASIGAAAVILGNITIGEYALVGAGALVTKDVPDRALVYGQPATIKGWLNNDGTKMISQEDLFIDCEGKKWQEKDLKLIAL